MTRPSEIHSSSGSSEKSETSFLIYVSIATKSFAQKDLVDLLTVSRRNNTPDGITGLLLFKEGKFLQVLEGEKVAVDRLFEKIKSDPRHGNVITLLSGEQEGRGFADFSMGFQNLDDPSIRSLPGYSPYLDTPLSVDGFSDDPTNAQRLLRIFKRTALSL